MKNYIKELKKNKENSILVFWFTMSSLLNAILLRALTVGNIFNLKPFLIDLAILLVGASFSYLISPKKRIRYLLTLSIITTAICIINSIYYTYYKSFASLSLLATSTQVVDVGDAIFKNVLKIKDLVYIWQPIFICYIHKKMIKQNYYEKKSIIKSKIMCKKICLTGLILLLSCALFVTPTEWSRFAKLWNREYVVMKFGIYTYQINDFFQSIMPKINTLFGYDNALKKVTDYYQENKVKNTTNEYTNIFKGKNIIAVHAESMQTNAMELTFNDEEVTPNLNKLAKEGIFFSNFYAEVGVGTSSDTEFTLNTSLMPSNRGTVFISYYDRTYETMPKLLKQKGYYTFSMHGNVGDFWNRLKMHKSLGYDKFYYKDYYKIDETIGFSGTGLSDKSFFKQSVPIIKKVSEQENKPFYATLITLSNHTPWDDLDLMDKFPTDYKIKTKSGTVSRTYLEGTIMGNYFRSVHYADQAIGQFIEELDKSGLLENTVIIIYGDHDARLSSEYYNILYNYDPINDKLLTEKDAKYKKIDELQMTLEKRVPFIIWTKYQQFNLKVEKPMGMIDVLPTLGNMFGFQNKYALGHDIFSTQDNIVVFTNGNFISQKYYYNSQKEITYSIKGDPIDNNYITKQSEYAQKIIEVSNNIINYDLIKPMKDKEKMKGNTK